MNQKQISLLIFLLAVVQFTHIVDFMIIMPMGDTLMNYFSIDGRLYSYLVSGYPIASFVINIFGVFFLDKFDRKKALLVAYVGFAVGTIACGILPSTSNNELNYALFLSARIFTGLFGGIMNGLVFSIVGDVIPFEKRATAMSFVMMAFSVASVFGVPMSLLMMNYWGWQVPYIVLGGLGVFVTIAIALFLPSMQEHLSASKKQSPLETLKAVIKTPTLFMALLFMLLMVMGQFSIIPFIAPYMISNVGFQEGQIFWIYFIGGAFTIVTSPFIGKLADKNGKKKLFFIMAFLSIIPLLWITHLGKVHIVVALIANALFFIFIGGRMVPANTIMTGLVPPNLRGGYMSMNSAMQSLALFLSSIISGMIVTAKQGMPIENYGIMGFIATGFSLLAILIMTRVEEPT